MAKCYSCQQPIEKDKVRINNKNFHPICGSIYQDSLDLREYICKIFGYKAPGPRILGQIKDYTTNYNFTHKGILNTLKYFYDVKGNTTKRSNGAIGIVPHIYKEAQTYYNNLDKTADKMSNSIKEPKTKIIQVETIHNRARKEKQKIDLSSLE